MTSVSLAEAKAHLSEIIRKVERGEAVSITRRGKEVARFVAPQSPRRPVDWEALRQLRESIPLSAGDDGEAVTRMRDDARY